MFIVGLKRLERERGSGWLDCPNCHEHALQDVVDAMRFAALGFYRFAPVERTRYLICRRCGFRREASTEEMAPLETMGRPLRRAWFVPFGVLALALVGGLAYFGFASPTQGAGVLGISFTNLNATSLLPATLDIPQNWNATFFTKPDDQPPPRLEVTTTSTGLVKIVLAKLNDSSTLSQVIVNHFSDQTSLASTGFPSNPPPAHCARIGDVSTAYVKVPFENSGARAEIIVYAFIKNSVPYTLTFVAAGGDNITLMEGVAKHSVGSLKFVAGGSPSPSAPTSASPSPSGSPAAAPSSSPAYTVSCH